MADCLTARDLRRELPSCEVEKLDDILLQLKATHPTVRLKTLRDLEANVRWRGGLGSQLDGWVGGWEMPIDTRRAHGWMVLQDGAYIVKLLDLFDICELDEDKAVLHRLFDIFYALGTLGEHRLSLACTTCTKSSFRLSLRSGAV